MLFASRFNGYTFHYVLIVATIMALLCSSLIFISGYYSSENESNKKYISFLKQRQSNLNFTLGNFQELQSSGNIQIDASTESRLKKWGFLEVILMSSTFNDSVYSDIYFLGKVPPSNSKQKLALYLEDSRKVLSIAGETNIEGDVFVPKKTIKRGQVGGQSYFGEKLVDGSIYASKQKMPEVKFESVEFIEKEVVRKNSIVNSFLNPTKVMQVDGVLDDVTIKGNVLISADNSITVSKDAILQDVIIKAPKIVIQSRFKGNAQFYAKDTLIVEEEVVLNYPSVLAINNSKAFMKLQSKSELHGAIYVNSKSADIRNTNLRIEETAKINGEVYVNGTTELRGQIYGGLVTSYLVYSTASGRYQNYIVDGVISSRALSKHYLNLLDSGGANRALLKKVF